MGSNSPRMGNPLAQLGYLPDHLESAIQNEVSVALKRNPHDSAASKQG
jgi:hypothetical protein